MSNKNQPGITRRNFLKKTTLASAGISAGLMASGNFAYADGSDKIRVGVIGCGGRGTGAARDCLTADEGVEIYAMGDLFRDRLGKSRNLLKKAMGDRVNVSDDRCFDGFDSYIGVMESDVDVVILATPPAFRPIHVKAAIERDKHIFMEKPVGVDTAGARKVIELGREAEQKGLSLVSGTMYRRQPSYVEAVSRIHDGEIGQLTGAQEYYLTGSVWLRQRKPGMSDMEWQCRNWYYFTWLSGDHIVEQFIHNIDTINWAFQAHPVKAIASGGRQVRVQPDYGHIYDHFSVEYEYPGGVRVQAMCRQMDDAERRITNRIVGTDGVAEVDPRYSKITSHDGEVLYESPESDVNPYVQTHVDLIASIRNNEPLNEARHAAESTLTAILGREAAYTGRALSWDDVYNADMDLVPDTFAFDSLPVQPVPAPGLTKLNRGKVLVSKD